jgi:hypothetical protein
VKELTATLSTSCNGFTAVAIDGDLIVAGAPADDDAGNWAGAVYIFDRNLGGPESWGLVEKLSGNNTDEYDELGRALAIDGDTLVVGAEMANQNIGSVYVFERGLDGLFTQVAMLSGDDPTIGARFGNSVAIENQLLAVGAFADSYESGRVYIYHKPDSITDWTRSAKLSGPGLHFGREVSLSGNQVVVGSTADRFWLFSCDPGDPSEWIRKIVVSDTNPSTLEYFAWSVAVSGNTALVGAMEDDEAALNAGAAYFYPDLIFGDDFEGGGADFWSLER